MGPNIPLSISVFQRMDTNSERQRWRAFYLMTACAAITFSSFVSTLPLVPILFNSSHPVLFICLSTALFFIPTIFLNHHLSMLRKEDLMSLFVVPPLLSSVSAMLVVFSPPHTEHKFLSAPHCLIPAATLLAGMSFCSLQTGLPAIIHFWLSNRPNCSNLPDAVQEQDQALRVLALNHTIALSSIVSPPLYVLFARFTSIHAVYLVLAFVHAIIGLVAFMSLPPYEDHTYTSIRNYPESLHLIPLISLTHENHNTRPRASPFPRRSLPFPFLREIVFKPWVAFVLFSMLVLSALLSLLRPVLSVYLLPHAVDTPPPSISSPAIIQTALLFSLFSLFSALAEWVVPFTVARGLGLRTTIVLALVITAIGFLFLPTTMPTSWYKLILPLGLIGFGSMTGLVIALTEMSQTTEMPLSPPSAELVVLWGVVLAIGEFSGSILPMLFMDSWTSFEPQPKAFERAISFGRGLSEFVMAAVTIYYVVVILTQWGVSPVISLFSGSNIGASRQPALQTT